MFAKNAIIATHRAAVFGVEKKYLSSQTTAAVQKLQSVLDNYRRTNYTQEIPSRFKKEIVSAAAANKSDIVAEDMERVLHNIGAHGAMTREEVQNIFREIGNPAGQVSSQRLLQIL